jgi:hypothetical protein
VETPAYDHVEVVETRECRLCSQPIDVRVDRCPYCQVVQHPARKVPITRVAVGIALVLAVGVAVFDPLQPDDAARSEGALSDGVASRIDESSSTPSAPEQETSGPQAQPGPKPDELAATVELLVAHAREARVTCQTTEPVACKANVDLLEHGARAFAVLHRSTRQSCAGGRRALLELVGSTDARIAEIFDSLYRATGACRPWQ